MVVIGRGWRRGSSPISMLLLSLISLLIRVTILADVDSVTVSGGYLKSGNKWYRAEGDVTFTTKGIYYRGKRVSLRLPVVIRPLDRLVRVNQISYPGEIGIEPGGVGLEVINRVDLEEYVASVVRWEMGSLGEDLIEALKAQAVAARTYSLCHHKLSAGIEDQVYKGYVDDPVIRRAVSETEGEILVSDGRPIDAKYHSTCGGKTAPPSEVWGVDDPPYLKAKKDPFCQDSPHYHWQRVFPLVEFYQRLGCALGHKLTGPVELELIRGQKSRRLIEVRIGEDRICGIRFRRLFGLKSTYFWLSLGRDSVIITGKGWGHGVGMCQWGAIGMAKRGYSYKQILGYYYPGAKLARLR